MNESTPPLATCLLCQRTLSKRGMGRHLKACRSKRRDGASKRGLAKHSFGLFVEGSPLYWLHLEADADLGLPDLDAFLRRTWLACCGHMSEFRIAQVYFLRDAGPPEPFSDSRSMNVPLREVLSSGTNFAYAYDMGSTTDLRLRVSSAGEASVKKGTIEIQARNVPPLFACSTCGKPAIHVCPECLWDDEGWLCEPCAKAHACGEEMLLPVVDSPRVGVCCYTG